MIKDAVARWGQFCGAALLGALALVAPRAAAEGFLDGARLCLYSLLPGLFPFFIVCGMLPALPAPRLLRAVRKMTGLQSDAAASALLLSWVGGYAVCARLTARLRREEAIPARDGALLALLGCCSGPGFVIFCIGGLWLGSTAVGVCLYVLQLAANLLAAALLLPLLPRRAPFAATATLPAPAALPQAIGAAVRNCAAVCGCVVFYSQLAAVGRQLLPCGPVVAALGQAVLEISGGCAAFAAQGGAVALYGCSAALSLLGLSVFTQLALLLEGTVPLRLLVLSRAVHLAVYLPLVHFAVRLLPGTAAVYSNLGGRVVPMLRLPPDAAAVAAVFLCAALYKARQSLYNK